MPLTENTTLPHSVAAFRGMPRWRARQRALPIEEKIALLGKFILETRRWEQIKKNASRL